MLENWMSPSSEKLGREFPNARIRTRHVTRRYVRAIGTSGGDPARLFLDDRDSGVQSAAVGIVFPRASVATAGVIPAGIIRVGRRQDDGVRADHTRFGADHRNLCGLIVHQ